MKRAVIVQGLGFGDEGKGATVDFLARELSADLVARFCGGSQAAHNVVLPDGRRHTFSQFGSGTLAGAATHLGEQVIIHPPAMHREARHLLELTGDDPFFKLTVHPRALVSTVYHQELNRLRELSRGGKRHGSCGHGIGETRHYWLRFGRDAVCAADLKNVDLLEEKLELLRQRALLDLQEFVADVPADESMRASVFAMPAAKIARELYDLGAPIELSAVIPSADTTIFEGAQGTLLDEWWGFHPHTIWSTVTLQHALAMAEEMGVEELSTLGITRTYATRHGAGPFPTFDRQFDEAMTDPGNPRNAWQGDMRFGWLDLVLLRYAADVVGGPLDGLVVNGFDQTDMGQMKICTAYTTQEGKTLQRLPVAPMPSISAQQRLTALLESATPVCENLSARDICTRLADELAPIAISGYGPTWQDRVLHDIRFRRMTPASAHSAFI